MNVRNRPWLLGLGLALLSGAAPLPTLAQAQPTQQQAPAQAQSQALPQASPLAEPTGSADAAPREILNSERIEATFGSYGIEVLETAATVRVSNLFSGVADGRVCRTFAIVRFASDMPRQIVPEHDAIVRGGSIGAVFTASGWRVVKTHLHFGTLAAGPRPAQIMRVAEGTALATHVYVLEVEKDGRRFVYATITELHHPEYLAVTALERIYGRADALGREALLAETLELATQKSQAAPRPPSPAL